jgi:hypothetical protein
MLSDFDGTSRSDQSGVAPTLRRGEAYEVVSYLTRVRGTPVLADTPLGILARPSLFRI